MDFLSGLSAKFNGAKISEYVLNMENKEGMRRLRQWITKGNVFTRD